MKIERSSRKLWLVRVLLATASPVVFFILAEIGLRLSHFGYSPHFFVPDAASGGRALIENSVFGYRFFPRRIARVPDPIRITASKPSKTLRIFVFGESAALGDPVPAYGFSRFLSVLLSF